MLRADYLRIAKATVGEIGREKQPAANVPGSAANRGTNLEREGIPLVRKSCGQGGTRCEEPRFRKFAIPKTCSQLAHKTKAVSPYLREFLNL